MKTLDLFIIHVPKRMKDTLTMSNGTEIYIDTKFNEFDHRVTEGEVLCSPSKYDTGVSEGDTLYFHHIVVINDGQPLSGKEDTYVVRFDPEHTINNQAIAYKNKKGEISTLSGWCLTEPVEQLPEVTSDIIEVVKLKAEQKTKARIKYLPKGYKGEVKVGDVVGFKANMDYDITIDGESLMRTRIEDLLYVEV
jgi:hypothetical protein